MKCNRDLEKFAKCRKRDTYFVQEMQLLVQFLIKHILDQKQLTTIEIYIQTSLELN